MNPSDIPSFDAESSLVGYPQPAGSEAADRSIHTRLLAAGERGLPLTFVVGLSVVAVAYFLLNGMMDKSTWSYEFLFRRSFVQWALLSAFAVGMVHLLRRIPEWLREKKAFRNLSVRSHPGSGATLVQRRWLKMQEMAHSPQLVANRHAAKSLADHDEAEIDGAYRLVADIVQVLPLIGFFGTVFGLSHGLYQSFLASGGATTKDFAKAIAVAFDNTLLGLGLTIVLFICTSLLRKREESLLLQLNLFAESWLPETAAAPAASPSVISDTRLQSAIEELESGIARTHALLFADAVGGTEPPEPLQVTFARLSANLSAVNQSLSAYGRAITSGVDGVTAAAKDEISAHARTMLSQVSEEVSHSAALAADGLRLELHSASTRVVDEISARIAETAAVTTGTGEKVDKLGEFLARVRERTESLTSLMERAATSVTGMAGQMDQIGTAMNAVEGKVDKIGELAASLPPTVSGLVVEGVGAKNDALAEKVVSSLTGSLGAEVTRLRDEVRRPRKIHIVDAPEEDPGS